ncbi:phosphotransferase family protein [Cohnella sp.]|uniref:phosphotransferase family protein n=1 Tax=Cohnella sp. TaxID=1883426 RepID=UPI00356A5855
MRESLQAIALKITPGARLLRARELPGGMSAQVVGLELEMADGSTRKIVVRQHGQADLARDPRIAAHEFRLLQWLRAAGAPVPEPYGYDESGETLPTPYVAIEYVEHEREYVPADNSEYARRMAEALAAIHRSDAGLEELAFLPRQDELVAERVAARPDRLDESLSEGRIRDTLERAWPPAQSNRTALLHGDFWPGNVLWNGSRLAAVIDWEDAALGDPLADLGNARLEMLWAYGEEAMEELTARYLSLAGGMDAGNLPVWDLYAALKPASRLSDWGLEPSVERAMREKHRRFVDRAMDKLR